MFEQANSIVTFIVYRYKSNVKSEIKSIFTQTKVQIFIISPARNPINPIFFYFLIAYGVCKKRKYFNRISEKKKFSLDECSCFVCLRRQNEQKKFPSVCLSVCLYVRTWTCAVETITFEGVSAPNKI